MRPDPRYLSMPSVEVGAVTRKNVARNCGPWSRWFSHRPLAWMYSPTQTEGASPSTVTRSRWPRTLTRTARQIGLGTAPERATTTANQAPVCSGRGPKQLVLRSHPTAIHGHPHAGHERGSVRTQPDNCRRDLFGLAQALDRLWSGQLRLGHSLPSIFPSHINS